MQPDMFETLQGDFLESENAPYLDLWIEVIGAVNQMLRNCPLSREQILDRVNLCLRDSGRKKVTMASLNKWLAPSQENSVPAWILPALCWACQSEYVFNVLLKPMGRKTVDERGDLYRQVTETKISAAAQLKQANSLEKQLSSMYVKDGNQ
jgi:hypothetical protein